MRIINKDILTVEKGVICQQVNCQGVMGSGLAKAIRDKWPIVYEQYKNFRSLRDLVLLGQYHYVNVAPDLWVCNIFGQLNYGYDGKRYTDYGALKMAFINMMDLCLSAKCGYEVKENTVHYFPFRFGCDRGGGDWSIVSQMIEFYFPNAIICKL